MFQKSEEVLVTGRRNVYSCETSRIPHSLENRLRDGGRFVLGLYCGWNDYADLKHPKTTFGFKSATFLLVTSCVYTVKDRRDVGGRGFSNSDDQNCRDCSHAKKYPRVASVGFGFI
jgi:hypothetical protein